jgi:hypothetical protein
MTSEQLLLPEGAVLVHIGPHKTGTTAVQRAMDGNRTTMASHGVLYPGTDYRHRRPVHALLGQSPKGWPEAARAEWRLLVDEVRAAGASRVCVSAEELARAEVEQIRTLVEDLGADRVHVAIGVRRLDALLRSEWQQRVQSAHATRTYDDWLRGILSAEPSGTARRFWQEHDLATVLDRWGKVLPLERVVLVVVSEGDRSGQPRAFESLLGLPAGTLDSPRAHNRNPSLSAERIELMRQVNEVCDRLDLSATLRFRYARSGFCGGLRARPREEQETSLPQAPSWARERLEEISAARAETVACCGAVVVGDPADLVRVETRAADDDLQLPRSVPIGAVIDGLALVLEEASRCEDALERAGADDLAHRSSRELLAEVARRQARRLRRGAGRADR